MADVKNSELMFGCLERDDVTKLLEAGRGRVEFGRFPVKRRERAVRGSAGEQITLPRSAPTVPFVFGAVAVPQGAWSSRLFSQEKRAGEQGNDQPKEYAVPRPHFLESCSRYRSRMLLLNQTAFTAPHRPSAPASRKGSLEGTTYLHR